MHEPLGKACPPVFVVGRFRSGTSALWNALSKLEPATRLYEPLHDNLPDYINHDTASRDESHLNVKDYWSDYKSVARVVRDLHRREFGISRLVLTKDDEYEPLRRYLVELARNCPARPLIKMVRADFRLGWLRNVFPEAYFVGIERHPRDQWASLMRGVAPELRTDPRYNGGYDIHVWLMSLASRFPPVREFSWSHSYAPTYLLHRLSGMQLRSHCDVVVKHEALVSRTRDTLKEVSKAAKIAPSQLHEAARAIVQAEFSKGVDMEEQGIFDSIEEEVDGFIAKSDWTPQSTRETGRLQGIDGYSEALAYQISMDRSILIQHRSKERYIEHLEETVDELRVSRRRFDDSLKESKRYTEHLQKCLDEKEKELKSVLEYLERVVSTKDDYIRSLEETLVRKDKQ